jgi:hypothetical protein
MGYGSRMRYAARRPAYTEAMGTPYRLRAHRPTTAASASTALGAPVRSYYAAASERVIWAAAPFAFLLAYGVWLSHDMQLDHWLNSTFSVFAVAGLFVLAIVLIVHTAAVGGGELLRVHADGLLDLRILPRIMRWDEIQSLTAVASEDGRDGRRHLLRATDGTTMWLGPTIGGIRDLLDEIRVRMAEHQLPEVCARLAAGGRVRFGDIAASDHDLAIGPRVVEWEDVEAIEAEAGQVVLRDRNGQRVAAAELTQVPNAFLLAELARIRRRARGGRVV